MQNPTKTGGNRVRDLTVAAVLATVGTPLLAAALFPGLAVLLAPLAIALPFFTMSWLEDAVLPSTATPVV